MSSWTDLTREPMIAWNTIKASWSAGWKALEANALASYEAMIVRDPEAFRPSVEAFFTEMQAARENLTRIAAKLGQLPDDERRPFQKQLGYLLDRWRTLAAGVLADSKPAPSVQGPPVVLIVVGVIVGLAAIAWAVAAYQYAVNLREQTALTEKELDARILASREGRQLPATTLPPQSSGMGATGWLMLAGVIAAGVFFGPKLLEQVGVKA